MCDSDSDDEELPATRRSRRFEVSGLGYVPPIIPLPHTRQSLLERQLESRKMKEVDDGYFRGRDSPPTIFRTRNPATATAMGELLFQENRYFRPKKIVIFIRGPPLTGKSYLAERIRSYEERFGNENVCILNGSAPRNSSLVDGPEHVAEHFEEVAAKGHRFVIIELKSSSAAVIKRCISVARSCSFAMYCIELLVDTNMAAIHNRMRDDFLSSKYVRYVRNYMSSMTNFSMPSDVTRLDPSDLYERNFRVMKFLHNVDEYARQKLYAPTTLCEDDFARVRELIGELQCSDAIFGKLPAGLEHSVNLEEDLAKFVTTALFERTHTKKKKINVVEVHLQRLPVFEPCVIIEYNHRHRVTVEEEVHDFHFAQSIDYRHQTNGRLAELVEDVDVDALLEEFKRQQFKCKMAYYRQFADVDKPISEYPHGTPWVPVEDEERPLPVKKRRKIKTKKKKTKAIPSAHGIQEGVQRLTIDDTFDCCCQCLARFVRNLIAFGDEEQFESTSSANERVLLFLEYFGEEKEPAKDERESPADSTENEANNHAPLSCEETSALTFKDLLELTRISRNLHQKSPKVVEIIELVEKIAVNLHTIEEAVVRNPSAAVGDNFSEIFVAIEAAREEMSEDSQTSREILQTLPADDKNANILTKKFAQNSNLISDAEKKLKTFEELLKNRQNPHQVPMDFDHPSRHIDDLLKRTVLRAVEDEQTGEFLEYIKSFYSRLDGVAALSKLLRTVAESDELEVVFELGEEPPKAGDDRKIFIRPKNKTEAEILASIASAFGDFAMEMVYRNGGRPYHSGNSDRKEELERVLCKIEMSDEGRHAVVRKFLEDHNEADWQSKVGGLLAEIFASGQQDEVRKSHEDLLAYFEAVETDIERFLNRFRRVSRMSVF